MKEVNIAIVGATGAGEVMLELLAERDSAKSVSLLASERSAGAMYRSNSNRSQFKI